MRQLFKKNGLATVLLAVAGFATNVHAQFWNTGAGGSIYTKQNRVGIGGSTITGAASVLSVSAWNNDGALNAGQYRYLNILSNGESTTFHPTLFFNTTVPGNNLRGIAAVAGTQTLQFIRATPNNPSVSIDMQINSIGDVVVNNQLYTAGWFRNYNAGTGLYNQATGAGIYSPYSGMMATYNNSNFTAFEIYSNSWFRNNAVGTGLYNQATGAGIYSPGAGMMATYNNSSFTVGGKLIVGNVPYSSNNYKLFVETGILTEKVRVAIKNTTNWSDYVFDENYDLPSLEQLETYIKLNHHLPNVPSATEVAKDGIDLGEMDAKLLAKIEELTLYAIDMSRRVEKLEKENGELKRKLK